MTLKALGIAFVSFTMLAGTLSVRGAEARSIPILIQSGRKHMDQQQWAEAISVFSETNRLHSKKNRNEKAEAAYLMGICMEELGQNTQASAAYQAVIATYTDEIEWASLALERQFKLLFPSKETWDAIAAYTFLRRNTYVIEFIIEARHDATKSPDALIRLLNLLQTITAQLQLTDDQISQIDQDLNIPK